MVGLSCTGTGERVCLSAEGFGNRQCFLEAITDRVSGSYTLLGTKSLTMSSKPPSFLQNVPPDLSQCVFVIEQALSVRALQELIGGDEAVSIVV